MYLPLMQSTDMSAAVRQLYVILISSISIRLQRQRDYLGRLSRLSIAIYTYVRDSLDRLSPEQILRLCKLSTSRRRALRDVISGHVTGTGSNDVGDEDDVTLREDTSSHACSRCTLCMVDLLMLLATRAIFRRL